MSQTVVQSASAYTTEIVTECQSTSVATLAYETTVVTNVGIVGPVGPQGPSGSETYVRKSTGALSALRVVRTTDATHVDYADAATLAHGETLLGISSTSAGVAEADVTVVATGPITDGSWSWTPGAPIFCGLNGVLTQTFSGAWAFSRIVAWAQTATTILVRIREPITLT